MMLIAISKDDIHKDQICILELGEDGTIYVTSAKQTDWDEIRRALRLGQRVDERSSG